MRKATYVIFLLSTAVIVMSFQGFRADIERVSNLEIKPETVKWTVDPSETTLQWTGYKGEDPSKYQHYGLISVSEGSLVTKGKKVIRGSFTIDMQTIHSTDTALSEEYAPKLEGHLASEDFFSIDSFPVAKLEIKKSKKGRIYGDLMVMGKTIPVKIPFVYTIEGEKAHFMADFSVDFTLLNMPATNMEGFDDQFEQISSKVFFKLRMTASK